MPFYFYFLFETGLLSSITSMSNLLEACFSSDYIMKYYYEKPQNYIKIYGEIYKCNHMLYNYCTLYKIKDKGLAVIQQKFNPKTKLLRWSDIDPWLANDIYLNPGFLEYFKEHAEVSYDGLYPTVTVRKIMWDLRMKPLKKEFWEDSQKTQFF